MVIPYGLFLRKCVYVLFYIYVETNFVDFEELCSFLTFFCGEEMN